MVKNPNWQETDQLAIYKHGRGFEPGFIEKQLQLSGQSRTWTCDLQISSPAPWPLGHAASFRNSEQHLQRTFIWQKCLGKGRKFSIFFKIYNLVNWISAFCLLGCLWKASTLSLHTSLTVKCVIDTGGGGYSQISWVGVCGSLPKTLTLFMTKICDFPYPIYDLAKNSIPYLWQLWLAQLP